MSEEPIIKKCPKCDFSLTEREYRFKQFDLAPHGLEDEVNICPDCEEILDDVEEGEA